MREVAMMLRLCAAFTALLLLLTGTGAQAEAQYDFDDLTLEELYEVRAKLDDRIEALESAEAVHSYGAGVYCVGVDIPEGDYAIIEEPNAMFASVVVRREEDSNSALILHKLITGQADISLRRDTWVTLSEVRAWPLGKEPSRAGADGTLPEGAYLVGVQLPAGRYRIARLETAPLSSYTLYAGIPGDTGKLMRFEVIHDPMELDLEEGDYIELSGCTLASIENEP